MMEEGENEERRDGASSSLGDPQNHGNVKKKRAEKLQPHYS
jgi:hypothetical protein